MPNIKCIRNHSARQTGQQERSRKRRSDRACMAWSPGFHHETRNRRSRNSPQNTKQQVGEQTDCGHTSEPARACRRPATACILPGPRTACTRRTQRTPLRTHARTRTNVHPHTLIRAHVREHGGADITAGAWLVGEARDRHVRQREEGTKATEHGRQSGKQVHGGRWRHGKRRLQRRPNFIWASFDRTREKARAGSKASPEASRPLPI